MNSTLFNLAGKTALVTGSSRGLGQAMAIGLAGAGAFVGITSRSMSSLKETSDVISASGGQVEKLVIDVSSPSEAKAEIRAFAEKHDGIDILINNAGYEEVCPSIDVSEELWDKISDTNLKGSFFCAQEAAKSMILSGRGGSIINVCSLTSSKSGLLGMTRALSAEWAKDGIRVNAVAPGYFRTDLTDTFYRDDNWAAAMLEKIPMGEFGNADDLHGSVIFLASDASKYITGQCIAIDGGYLASI